VLGLLRILYLMQQETQLLRAVLSLAVRDAYAAPTEGTVIAPEAFTAIDFLFFERSAEKYCSACDINYKWFIEKVWLWTRSPPKRGSTPAEQEIDNTNKRRFRFNHQKVIELHRQGIDTPWDFTEVEDDGD